MGIKARHSRRHSRVPVFRDPAFPEPSHVPDPRAVALVEETDKRNLIGGSTEGLIEGKRLLEEAIRIDPDWAEPYAIMAMYYFESSGWRLDPGQAMPDAEHFAKEALERDPRHRDALMYLAFIQINYYGDLEKAESILLQLEHFHPHVFGSKLVRAIWTVAKGDLKEA